MTSAPCVAAAALCLLGCAGSSGEFEESTAQVEQGIIWPPPDNTYTLNNDSLTDVITAPWRDATIRVGVNDRGGAFNEYDVIPNNGWGNLDDNYYPADFNGDGYVDLGYLGGDYSFHVTTNQHTPDGVVRFGGTAFASIPSGGFGHANGHYYVGNFDGIKGDDLAFFEGGNSTMYVTLSTRTSFGGAFNPRVFSTYTDSFYPGDFNCDGKTDLGIWLRWAGEFYVSLSNGTGFDEPFQWIKKSELSNSGGRFVVGAFYGTWKYVNFPESPSDSRAVACDDLGFFSTSTQSFYTMRSNPVTKKFTWDSGNPVMVGPGNDSTRNPNNFQAGIVYDEYYADLWYTNSDGSVSISSNYEGSWSKNARRHYFNVPGRYYLGKRSR